jgi:hypothetical protein
MLEQQARGRTANPSFQFQLRWLGLGFLALSLLVQEFGLTLNVPMVTAASLSTASNNVSDRFLNDADSQATSKRKLLEQSQNNVLPFAQELAQRGNTNNAAFSSSAAQALLNSHLVANAKASAAVAKAGPHVTFANTYYANKVIDDAGADTAVNCLNPANASCSLRSALTLAGGDSHNTVPDLILLIPNNLNSTRYYKITTPALPVVPDYIYLSSTNDLSCPYYSNAGYIQGPGSPTSLDGLQLGNYDYINEIYTVSFNNGITINGSHNTITCVVSAANSNGINFNSGAKNNQIGGVLGDVAGISFGFGGSEILASLNTNSGIVISGTNITGNQVLNTAIGLLLANYGSGLVIGNGASNNLIGSTALTQTNTIAYNLQNGVVITGTGTTGNQLFGNHIGTDITGTTVISNTYDGVLIGGGASANQIGGNALGQENVIGGNGSSGIAIVGNSNNNIIQGNYIGVAADGSGPLYNGSRGPGTNPSSVCRDAETGYPRSEDCAGIFLDGPTASSPGPTGTLIGGNFNSGQGNLIAADSNVGLLHYGVLLDFAANNTIQGNSIASRISGSSVFSYPTAVGIGLYNGASGNQIGGDSTQGQGNLIGAVSYDAMEFYGFGFGGTIGFVPFSNNKIQGNAIGVDFTGASNPNLTPIAGAFGFVYGLYAVNSSNPLAMNNNLIGVDLSVANPNNGQANLYGNVSQGLHWIGNTIDSNQINNNRFGVNRAGTAVTPIRYGIVFAGPTGTNTKIQGNYIGSTNITTSTTYGVFLSNGVTGTQVIKNYIGTNPSGANFGFSYGIYQAGGSPVGSSQVTISQNVIAFSKIEGILVGSSSSDQYTQRNTISQNSIYSNNGLGININYAAGAPTGVPGGADSGPNNQAQIPTISAATAIAIKSSATIVSGTANPSSTVEVFLGDNTGSSTTQGKTYLGTTTADSSGNFTATVTLPASIAVSSTVAFVATSTLNNPANRAGSTSQFSAPFNATVTAPTYTYYLPFLANAFNPGFTTFVAIQNAGNVAANINIQYYDTNGNALAAASVITTVNLYGELIAANPLATGTKGTGQITSNQPLNLIVAEATPYGGSAYAVSGGAYSTLDAPFAFNNTFGGYTTQLTVYNAGNTVANATVNFYDTTGASPAGSTKNLTIQPHQSTILNQGDAASNIPTGFNGWAQVVGASGSTLVAQVLEQNPTIGYVAIANAQSNTSTTVNAPAIFYDAYGSFITGADIVNPNSNPVTVSVTYYNLSGQAITTAPFALPANGLVSIYHGATSAGPGLPGSGLPKGFAGTAVVNAVGGGVIMAVNEYAGLTAAGSPESGTYLAAASGGSNVGIPVIANNGFGYTTGTTVFNASSQTVTATLQYYSLTGLPSGNATTVVIGPYASAAFYQGDSAQGLSSGFYGTAFFTQSGGGTPSLIDTTNAVSNQFFYTFTEPNQ